MFVICGGVDERELILGICRLFQDVLGASTTRARGSARRALVCGWDEQTKQVVDGIYQTSIHAPKLGVVSHRYNSVRKTYPSDVVLR